MKKKGKPSKKDKDDEDHLIRIAIVNADKCKPKKCRQECKKYCPVVRMGKQCIEVDHSSKVAYISEELCIGCGICVKKCPFHSITIINLPKSLEKETVHRFGPNSFKLHRLPVPRPGQVLGLVGTNGIGKTTALSILAGRTKPNLGLWNKPPEWPDILTYFRGNELQNYFTKILEEKYKSVLKPQYVDDIGKMAKMQNMIVGDSLNKIIKKILDPQEQKERYEYIVHNCDLINILNRHVSELSGGELQRFSIATAALRPAEVFFFDEPSSYLDVYQRLKAGNVIRSLLKDQNYVIVVEHDLAVLDYLSDFVCCLYGTPAVYGVVTMPFSVREGINVFLAGFIPTENLRFRDYALSFKIAEKIDDISTLKAHYHYTYPSMSKTFGSNDFKLYINAGEFNNSEIIVLLGRNGTGKTTLIRMLAGIIPPDEKECDIPELSISYKPQQIPHTYQGTVRDFFQHNPLFTHPQFRTDVVKPMYIEDIMDNQVCTLSGGELQRVALVKCLATPADVYLIDEPSAYLDSEQRIVTAKVIKRFILHYKKTAFVVEHDFIMATYLADKVIVYEGEPARDCIASKPQPLLSGINAFLEQLEITFRRDPINYRPRINKFDSQLDRDQKLNKQFFFLDTDNEK